MPVIITEKNCLVYYLLKEYCDGRETRFAIDRLIPSHFSRGLDGLWALDHSQWKVCSILSSRQPIEHVLVTDIFFSSSLPSDVCLTQVSRQIFYQKSSELWPPNPLSKLDPAI
jgi:hypothetical protein